MNKYSLCVAAMTLFCYTAHAQNDIRPLEIKNAVLSFDVKESQTIDAARYSEIKKMLDSKAGEYLKAHPDGQAEVQNQLRRALAPLTNYQKKYRMIVGFKGDDFCYAVRDSSTRDTTIFYDSKKNQTITRVHQGSESKFNKASTEVAISKDLDIREMSVLPIFGGYPKAFDRYKPGPGMVPTISPDEQKVPFSKAVVSTRDGQVSRIEYDTHIGTWIFSDDKKQVEGTSIPEVSTFETPVNFFMTDRKILCGKTQYEFHLTGVNPDATEMVSSNFVKTGDVVNGHFVYDQREGPLEEQSVINAKPIPKTSSTPGYILLGALILGVGTLIYRRYRAISNPQ